MPATFVLFPVLSLRYSHVQLRSLYPLSTFDASHVRKIPGSPHLHNFNVCVPERGSLGTRLISKEAQQLVSQTPCIKMEQDWLAQTHRGYGWLPVQCPVCAPAEGKVLRLMTKALFPKMFSRDCLVAMASVNPAVHKDCSEWENSKRAYSTH